MDLDRTACYRALLTRDVRFDGRFFTGVLSTGIYCRPICPARPPKLENCIFYPTAAAAQRAGLRSCLRCRPEVAPTLSAWQGTSATVQRALNLIENGSADENDLPTLAARLGIGERHLRRLFHQHLGTSPKAVTQTRRILFAKQLITDTSIPMTDVALATGFRSVRRFNAAIRQLYGCPPRELRRNKLPAESPIRLTLPFSPPYDWTGMLDFLRPRAIPGIEVVEPKRYWRTVEIGGVHGIVAVSEGRNNSLCVEIRFPRIHGLREIVRRLRCLFDLSADPFTIRQHLAQDPSLGALLSRRPGLRVPGSWDGFEVAVRAILGQQVTVSAATQLAGRLVAELGQELSMHDLAGVPSGLNAVFPRPVHLRRLDSLRLGMPSARQRALQELARLAENDAHFFQIGCSLEEATERLKRVPGIGDWTAQYIAMRILREPDAFPARDVALLRCCSTTFAARNFSEMLHRADQWRPWRAYAAMHLWAADAEQKQEVPRGAVA